MSFFKKLFGGQESGPPEHKDFQEGDIFYTQDEGQFHIYKLLKYEQEHEILHVMGFEEVATLPPADHLKDLKVKIYHFPISRMGFKNPILLTRSSVEEGDLLGYLEYCRQTGQVDELVKYAKKYYQEAYQLSDQKDHHGAIQKYEKAYELIPNFYEAIDNRAFCFMDLGQWDKAIAGFNHSLQINPNSFLAIFSIGECYLRMQDYEKAKIHFEKAIELDPSHPKPKEFLALTLKLMNQ